MGLALQTMIRDLHRRRGRERRRLAIAEGVRLVEEVLAAQVPCRAIVTSPALESTERGRALKRALLTAPVGVTEVTDATLADLAATDHPQGVLAVVTPPAWTLERLAVGARAVLVVLDGLQDPGNVGTITRTALAFGATAVIALPGTAEWTNPKTLRASMGAGFRLPIVTVDEDSARAWLAEHEVTIAATATDGVSFDRVTLPDRVAFILGNEGAGLRSALAQEARLRLAIPLDPGVESLNVAVAAGIFLYGATRDR